MEGATGQILDAFILGDINAVDTKRRLLSLFSTSVSSQHMKMICRYLDEILADLEAGQVSPPLAAEGVEEAAAASHVPSASR